MERLKKLLTNIKGFEGPLTELENIEIDSVNYEITIRMEKIIIVISIYDKEKNKYVFYKTLNYTSKIFEIVKEWKIWELGIRTEVSQKEIEKIIFEIEFLEENNKTSFPRNVTDFLFKLNIKKVEISKTENNIKVIKVRIIEEYNYPVVIEHQDLIFKFDAKEKLPKFDKIANSSVLRSLIGVENYFKAGVPIDEVWQYID
jgi:hypothetical protein